VVSCLLLAAPACGGSPDAGPADARTSHDAPAHDAPTHDAPTHDAPVQDAPVAGGVISNTPGATVVDRTNSVLVLRSSNLLQHPSAGQVFQEWFGEVQNTGSTTICFAQINANFLAADGAQLATFNTFADTDPYTDSSGLTIPCLAPGQIGGIWDNALVATTVPLAAIKTISIEFDHAEFDVPRPAPDAPLVTSHVASVFDGFAVTGTITGRSAPISNIGLDIFPRDANGLVFDIMFATDLGTLNPGEAFPFTTVSTSTAFSQYRVFADFIDGAEANAAISQATRSTGPTAFAALAAARGQQRDQARARAALAATRR